MRGEDHTQREAKDKNMTESHDGNVPEENKLQQVEGSSKIFVLLGLYQLFCFPNPVVVLLLRPVTPAVPDFP